MKQLGSVTRRIPFVKLVLALIGGILSQYYLAPVKLFWLVLTSASVVFLICFFGFSYFRRYTWSLMSGIATIILYYSIGGLLTVERDITNDRDWFGKYEKAGGHLVAVTEEAPIEKANSYKYTASVILLSVKGKNIPVKGRIFIYLKKSSVTTTGRIPGYGTQLIFRNDLAPITGFGNPGGFDYSRYCRLKGITKQIFLDSNDHIILSKKRIKIFPNLIQKLQTKIVEIIRKYIPGKKESGLAEALLIGYKQDLDKSLVQSYSDTGVVHIIAISGLHVGLIYWLLSLVFSPLKKAGLNATAAILTIAGLWIFSFLAGAQPSLLRAALMFSCIIIGKVVAGKPSIYNNIACSSFILLCIDPFWLWDAGFQLSYAAVTGIIAFMKPIYNLVYIKNRFIDQIWKMNAVTLAAQVFTLPLCLYYFHQFPIYFLITNFVAVPLSTIILFGEILLLVTSVIPLAAIKTGWVLNHLLGWMNDFVTNIASLPFATLESLQVSTAQAGILILFSFAFGFGLLERLKNLLGLSGLFILTFFCIRSLSFSRAARQEMIIVYNLPRHTAIDLVKGRAFDFVGDTIFGHRDPEKKLYLDPSRCLFRTSLHKNFQIARSALLTFSGKRIWRIHQDIKPVGFKDSSFVDILILSGNPKIFLKDLAALVRIRQVVIDASVPKWKAGLWKKDCESLSLPCHDVSMDGAFVMIIR